MKRNLAQYLIVFLKGIAMGAADVVPGVSGGTIAFITGIYEELIASLNSFDFGLIKEFKQNGIKAVWNKINGSFLTALLFGVFISIFSLSSAINYLLNNFSILLWSFFFGLIIASIWLMIKQIKEWNIASVIGLIIGTYFVYFISTVPSITSIESPWFIFISGMISICAMILPGISGSFILLLIGAYQVIINAISQFNGKILFFFFTGCIFGLLSFSKLLNYLFKKYKNLTIATLTGFLIGSLYKIWPWKKTLTIFIKHKGEVNEKIISLEQINVLPKNYTIPKIKGSKVIEQIQAEPQLMYSILLMVFGALLLIFLEKIALQNKNK